MPTSTSGPPQGKREFYRLPTTSRSYDNLRFGGASGRRINLRELNLAASFLAGAARVLDVACGTGRLGAHLEEGGAETVSLDASPAMLAEARGRGLVRLVAADAFHLPVAEGAFDAVAAMRLLFHFQDPAPILAQMRRACRPGGVLVFDTCRFSPRGLLALFPGTWGGRVHCHRARAVRAMVEALRMEVEETADCYLLTPYLYRRLPLGLAGALERLEAALPRALRCRTFWKVRR